MNGRIVASKPLYRGARPAQEDRKAHLASQFRSARRRAHAGREPDVPDGRRRLLRADDAAGGAALPAGADGAPDAAGRWQQPSGGQMRLGGHAQAAADAGGAFPRARSASRARPAGVMRGMQVPSRPSPASGSSRCCRRHAAARSGAQRGADGPAAANYKYTPNMRNPPQQLSAVAQPVAGAAAAGPVGHACAGQEPLIASMLAAARAGAEADAGRASLPMIQRMYLIWPAR